MHGSVYRILPDAVADPVDEEIRRQARQIRFHGHRVAGGDDEIVGVDLNDPSAHRRTISRGGRK